MIRRKSNIERVEKRLAKTMPDQSDGDRDLALWISARQLERIGQDLTDDSVVDDFLLTMAVARLSPRPSDEAVTALVRGQLAEITRNSPALPPYLVASMKYALYSSHQNTIRSVGTTDLPRWPWPRQEAPQHGKTSASSSDR